MIMKSEKEQSPCQLIDEQSQSMIKRSILLASYIKHIDEESREKLLAIESNISFNELMTAISDGNKDRVKENIDQLSHRVLGNA